MHDTAIAGFRGVAAVAAVAIASASRVLAVAPGIVYPRDGAVFPPEIPPPTVVWEGASNAVVWDVRVDLGEGAAPVTARTAELRWTASDAQWQTIKTAAVGRRAVLTVSGRGAGGRHAESLRPVTFGVSSDPVGAPIFYREVNLPFRDAVRDPSAIRWRVGSVSAERPPPVVLEGLPVCANCHSFSADGATLGMDVDYANDKGSYAIVPVAREIVLAASNTITWSDFRRADGVPTFGMLSQVSPDGRYVVSTVKDRSVFVDRPDLAFSQLFFPVKGILAVYGRTTRTFSPLAGADDPAYVQTNPAWSPDGQWLVFARSKAHRLPDARNPNAILLTQQECREFLREGKTFSFDLYRLPFNGGRGGKPEPLKGASFNGKSNFFPKFSPDGRWIVFCQARSFMLLQPDSELYIVPAEGGDARRLDGNTPRMNSWHSWSPNGRWLVFSSKANGPYTQLWLTQMDPGGNSAPPVLLDRLTEAGRAANIPEFVPAGEAAIAVIRERYLDAVSYVRAGNELRLAGDLGAAEKKYRLALALAPDNVDALVFLGFVLMARSAFDEATASLLKAIGLDPSNAEACFHLAVVRARQGRTADAERFFAASLRARPDYAVAHAGLGLALEQAGRADEAIRHYRNALRCDPAMATVHCDLGRLLAARGLLEESASHLLEACRLEPDAPQAVAVLRQVARQAAASGRGDLARKIEDRLLGGP